MIITPQEAAQAPTAICLKHGSKFAHLNELGRVYYCPIGREHWRHEKAASLYKPLRFPKGM